MQVSSLRNARSAVAAPPRTHRGRYVQAGDVELGQLFIDNHQFRIPMFQRPYVWAKTKNWLPLWIDLVAAAEAVLEEVASGELAEEPPTYFLGAVVVKP